MASDSPSDQVRPDADVVVGLRLAARVEFFVFARPLHDEVLAPARMNERDLGIVIEDRLGEIAAMNRIGARAVAVPPEHAVWRSEAHTSELQSLLRISYADFSLK